MQALKKLGSAWILSVILGAVMAVSAPATLRMSDVVGSPERWPDEITVPKDLRFQGGASVKQGQLVKLVGVEGAKVVVDDGHGLVFELAAAETDFLTRANAMWGKLTAEQRAITADSLVETPELWPVRVRCDDEFELDNGAVLKAGREYELVAVKRDGVQLYDAENSTKLRARPQATDLFAQARALALVPEERRPSRIAAALRGKLVDATGHAATADELEDTQLFALYYGASWCGPCRKFSPDLVKFVERVGAENPRLTVVLMSNDKSDTAMQGYMREERMPWLALPLARLVKEPVFTGYLKGGIPQLVVVNRHGKILADSYRGSTYIGPLPAMQQLERLLDTGVAKRKSPASSETEL